MQKKNQFNADQLSFISDSVLNAEEIVSDYFKMTHSQWRRAPYDVRTIANLTDDQVIYGPFAQVIRYAAQRHHTFLGTSAYDFYLICLQDHNIIETLNLHTELSLSPFMLYIMIHELVHIIRFSRFLQRADTITPSERVLEELRVNQKTYDILTQKGTYMKGIQPVLEFFKTSCIPEETCFCFREMVSE